MLLISDWSCGNCELESCWRLLSEPKLCTKPLIHLWYILKIGLMSHIHPLHFFWYCCHRGGKTHMARLGLEPRTSRIPCKLSDHWATEPHGRPVTIPPCLIRFVPRICQEPCRNRRDSPFAAPSPSTDPHWATKCHWGGKKAHGPTGIEPRTSRILCKLSDHWATEPHGWPVTLYLWNSSL